MSDRWDVAIIGGGVAGTAAAIQAGRAAARVLLVEKNGCLGGTLTVAGIVGVQSFRAYDTQVIAGIGYDLVCRTRELCGQPPPSEFKPGRAGVTTVSANAGIFAALAAEAAAAAGVTMQLHTMLAAVQDVDGAWRLTLCTKTGLREVTASVLVDCTADANAVSLAGFPLRQLDERQPGTLVMTLAGYDPATLDYAAIQAAFDREVAAGRLAPSDTGWSHGSVTPLLRQKGGNVIHVLDVDGGTSEGRSHAELAGRAVLLRLMRFLRTQPGLENLVVASCAAEVGIRETAGILGKATITVDDYMSGRLWDDAVCYSFYPIDVHRPKDIDYRVLPPGTWPTIPLRAMLPAGSRRLVAAGRCISGDRLAHSAFRVEASCMAMGQAAGAVAVLAAARNVDVEEVPLADLRALLRQHGAIVPGDLPAGAPAEGAPSASSAT